MIHQGNLTNCLGGGGKVSLRCMDMWNALTCFMLLKLGIALMRVYVRLDNFTTKPRFQSANLYILLRTKFHSKNEKNIHVQYAEDENNLVQTRLGGGFRTSNVIMHKAH